MPYFLATQKKIDVADAAILKITHQIFQKFLQTFIFERGWGATQEKIDVADSAISYNYPPPHVDQVKESINHQNCGSLGKDGKPFLDRSNLDCQNCENFEEEKNMAISLFDKTVPKFFIVLWPIQRSHISCQRVHSSTSVSQHTGSWSTLYWRQENLQFLGGTRNNQGLWRT